MTRRVTISVSVVDPALLRRQVGRLAEAEAALRWGYNPRAITMRGQQLKWADAIAGVLNMLAERSET